MRRMRRLANKIGVDMLPMLFCVKRADILAQSDYLRQEKLERLEKWQELYQDMRSLGQCVCLKDLAVTGRDLMDIGMRPGKELGEALQGLLELVLEEPAYNTKEKLLKEAEKYL